MHRAAFVLQVQQGHAAGELPQQLHRIVAGHAHPEAVHFKAAQVLVQAVHHHLKTGCALHRLEFESVVVIAEGKSGGAALLARTVQLVGEDAELFEATALGGRQVRKNGVGEAPFLRLVDGPRQIVLLARVHQSIVQVDAHRLQVSSLNGLPEPVETAERRLDLAISDCFDGVQRLSGLLGKDAANGVKLDADRLEAAAPGPGRGQRRGKRERT